MVPFVRTLGEASQVVDLLAENGLKRGDNGLRVIMLCILFIKLALFSPQQLVLYIYIKQHKEHRMMNKMVLIYCNL